MRRERPTPRWPAWVMAGLLLLSVAALIAVVSVALSRRDDSPAGAAPAYVPIGNERPPGLAMPDRSMSPGDVFPDATVADICKSGYASRVRDVSTDTKNGIYAAYHIKSHAPGEYEVDHIVPLSLGGSNDIKNLYPEPAEPKPGFHEKDVLEVTLHGLVCAGSLDLRVAQDAIATDWWTAYVKYVLKR